MYSENLNYKTDWAIGCIAYDYDWTNCFDFCLLSVISTNSYVIFGTSLYFVIVQKMHTIYAMFVNS